MLPEILALLDQDFIQILIQIAIASLFSIILGFFIARWMYRAEAVARVSILQHEILRLRRRLTEKEDKNNESERHRHRFSRMIRSMK